MTPQGEKEVLLPLLHCKNVSLAEYISELNAVGLNVIASERSGDANMNFEAIIIAQA